MLTSSCFVPPLCLTSVLKRLNKYDLELWQVLQDLLCAAATAAGPTVVAAAARCCSARPCRRPCPRQLPGELRPRRCRGRERCRQPVLQLPPLGAAAVELDQQLLGPRLRSLPLLLMVQLYRLRQRLDRDDTRAVDMRRSAGHQQAVLPSGHPLLRRDGQPLQGAPQLHRASLALCATGCEVRGVCGGARRRGRAPVSPRGGGGGGRTSPYFTGRR